MTIKPWDHFRVEGEKIIFTAPKPKRKFQENFLKLGMKIETDEYRGWKLANNHFIGLNSITKKLREEIFKTFKKGGITVGETAKLFNVSSEIVGDILMFNMDHISMLKESSI